MKWYKIGLATLGTKEVPGTGNSATIKGWAKKLGARVLGMVYNADSVPWCGLFVSHCMNEAGIVSPSIPLRAMSWATWGSNLPADKLVPGAVLVFLRPGGGHVGFYHAEDATAYHVLGGNQSDAVTITRIDKARCVARQWPKGVAVTGKPVIVAATGKLSTNEA